MHPDKLERLMEDKRLELEARDRAHWRKARRKNRVQPKLEQTQPQHPKKEVGDKTGTQPTATFFGTWNTMYRRRMKGSRVNFPFVLPESLLDTGFRVFELTIERLVFKLLK